MAKILLVAFFLLTPTLIKESDTKGGQAYSFTGHFYAHYQDDYTGVQHNVYLVALHLNVQQEPYKEIHKELEH